MKKTEKIINYDNLQLILSTLDQLIFYINNNKYDENSIISDILENAGSVMNLNDCSKLINENGIIINELPSLYDYIEAKIFPTIKQNIKNQIINNELNKIFTNVNKIIDDNNEYINKDNFLRALRKLNRYFPENRKYFYRCINSKVELNYDSFDKKKVPYICGEKKIFWAFTSASTNPKTSFMFLGNDENNYKTGTIFSFTGDVWGYDISLFRRNIIRT